jgi:hypothetical protein
MRVNFLLPTMKVTQSSFVGLSSQITELMCGSDESILYLFIKYIFNRSLAYFFQFLQKRLIHNHHIDKTEWVLTALF